MQSLAKGDKNVKITQNRIFLAKNTPLPELELLTEDFVHETGVWRLIAVYPTETMKQRN